MHIFTQRQSEPCDTLIVKITGHLDTNTAAEAESLVNERLGNPDVLIFDLEQLEYISSAGLRFLLRFEKMMNKLEKSMIVRNVPETVMDIFEVTGFSEILTLE